MLHSFIKYFDLTIQISDHRSHVWGHFCLCYKGQKLLDYKAYIRLFGIKDGDQVEIYFIFCHLNFNLYIYLVA